MFGEVVFGQDIITSIENSAVDAKSRPQEDIIISDCGVIAPEPEEVKGSITDIDYIGHSYFIVVQKEKKTKKKKKKKISGSESSSDESDKKSKKKKHKKHKKHKKEKRQKT